MIPISNLLSIIITVTNPLPPIDIYSLPAVITIYDPELCYHGQPINCDGDPTTISTGPMLQEYYKTYMACDISLLGAYIRFPGIGEFRCMDTGSMIRPMWSDHFQQYVLYFDVLWPLTEEDPPPWNYYYLPEWSVSW
jgi:hypothetical protein